MNVSWTLNVLDPILFLKQRSLMKPTMNVKDISILLKCHSKKDSGTILETSNIKSMRKALIVQSIYDFKILWYYTNS